MKVNDVEQAMAGDGSAEEETQAESLT